MRQGNASTSTPDDVINAVNPILRTIIIVGVSMMITVGNMLNLRILRMTKQIPAISRMCLLNLSCSDLLVGVVACAPCVYPAATGRWPFGAIWCQIAGITHGVSVTVSIWSLALVSVDRYVAIVHPLHYYVYVTEQRCGRVLATLWVVAFVTYAAPLPFYGFVYYEYSVAELMCGLHWADPWFCIVTGLFVPILSGCVLAFTTAGIKRAVAAMNRVGVAPGTSSGPSRTACGNLHKRNSEFSQSRAATCESVHIQTVDEVTSGCSEQRKPPAALAERHSVNGQPIAVDSVDEMNTVLDRLQHNLQNIAKVIRQSRGDPDEECQSGTVMNRAGQPGTVTDEAGQSGAVTDHDQKHVQAPRIRDECRIVASCDHVVDVVHETTRIDNVAGAAVVRRHQAGGPAGKSHSRPGTDVTKKEMKMMKLLVVTVLAFFVSWGPYVIVNVLLIAILDYHQVSPVVRFVSTWLGNSNSFVNIVIYSLVYSTFRRNATIVVRAVFFCHLRREVHSVTDDSVTL